MPQTSKQQLISQFIDRFEEASKGTPEPMPIELLEVAIDIRDELTRVAAALEAIFDIMPMQNHH